MKVHYIACAQSSSLDSRTNRLSLFHILDEIAGAAFPLTLPSLCVATLFEREAEDEPAQSFVLAVALDAKLIASFTLGVDFARSRRNRTVNTVQGLIIPAPGLVTISLLQKTTTLAVWQALAVSDAGGGRAAGSATRAAEAPPHPGAPKNALAVN